MIMPTIILYIAISLDGFIDEYIISIVPVVLGNGIPLFSPPITEEKLMFVESKQYPSGLIQVTYKRKSL